MHINSTTNLRNAIANDAFKNLTESEQGAYTAWVMENLTPVKD